MSPLGLRGFSQLSCRESGLRAVKTRGPGALGVLRVNGEPAVKDKRQGLHEGIVPAGLVCGETESNGSGTWHGAEGTLGVDCRLDGDDSFSLWTPALLALGLHLEQVGVVGQQVLDDDRVLRWVRHIDAIRVTCKRRHGLFSSSNKRLQSQYPVHTVHYCCSRVYVFFTSIEQLVEDTVAHDVSLTLGLLPADFEGSGTQSGEHQSAGGVWDTRGESCI